MPRKPGLDTAQVVRAAAELIDQEGLEGLTLNRLARRLSIQTPSLYNHVGGMPGLQRELARLNAHELGLCLTDAALGKSGAEALQSVAQAYRAYIKAHPGLYLASLRASGREDPPDLELQAAEDRVVRVALAVVASFGLQGEDGLHAVRGLRSLIHGFATLEIAGGFGLPLDCDESFRRLLAMFIQGLSPCPPAD